MPRLEPSHLRLCRWIAASCVLMTAAFMTGAWRGPLGAAAESGHSAPRVALDEETVLSDAPPPSEGELEEPLYEVRIEGNVTIPTSDIAKNVKSRPGRPPLQKNIKEDVDALEKTRWFMTVEPYMKRTEEGNVLVFRVVERPIVKRVSYLGNSKVKTSKLEAITNLKEGSPFDVAGNRQCASRMEDYYHEKGFVYATVELEKGDSREDREVVFRIYEGPKVHVVGAKFEGNDLASDALLRLKLRSKIRKFWLFGGKYDPSTIEDDVAALNQYYVALGYFDVQITPGMEQSEDRANVTLKFEIDEGPRYRIRHIRFEGNQIYATDELQQDFRIHEGQYYNAREIALDVQKVRDKYGALGRMFAKIDAVPRYIEDEANVDLIFKIDEDKVYRIRKVNVHFLGDYPHTRNKLPLNVARIRPGDLADPKKIEGTRVRLEGSQYFERGPENGVKVEVTRVDKTRPWFASPEGELARGQTGAPPAPAPRSTPPASAKSTGTSRAPAAASSQRPGEFVIVTPGAKSTAAAKPPQHNPATTVASHSAPSTSRSTNSSQHVSTSKPPATPRRATDKPARVPDPVDELFSDAPETMQRDSTSRRDIPTPSGARLWTLPSTRGERREPRSQETISGDRSDLRNGIERGQSPLRGQSPITNAAVPPSGDNFYSPDRSFDRSIRDPDPSLWQDMPPPEFIDVDAYLTEARTGRLMLGVGVNSNSGLVGNAVLQENNFDILRPPTSWDDLWSGSAWRGGGQQFRIEAMPGTQVSRYVVDWQDPYFLDTDYNLGVSGFYYQRFFEYWNEQRVGGRVRVGRQFTPNWSGSLALRLEDITLYNAVTFGPPRLNEATGGNFLSTVRASMIHDTRDASFLTSEGHRVEFSYEQAFAEFNYPRFEVDASQYFTTYRRPDGYGKHILSLSSNLSWTGSDTPIFERYFAGGYSSFRGFRFRGVSPIESNVRVGGTFMSTSTLEYSIPVTASENFRVVGFTDFGTVENDVSLDNFRLSVGAGMRITIPAMGPVPIALDWAIPLMKQDFDRRQIFSFYLGVNY